MIVRIINMISYYLQMPGSPKPPSQSCYRAHDNENHKILPCRWTDGPFIKLI